MPPSSTYRVQLHAGFDFADAAALSDYLDTLGVSHLYCSPYLQAASGSAHGYDVVDPRRLSDELGGAAGHALLVGALQQHGLRQVLDIVPNHMAADAGNEWWWDVLENGPASWYASFFDIDWPGADAKSAFTVLVPVLGDHYGRVLEAGDLRLERRGGAFVVRYHDHQLPVSPRTVDQLLAAAARRAGSAELAALAEGFASLPPARVVDDVAVSERHDHKSILAAEVARVCASDDRLAAAIEAEVESTNHDIDRLDELLRRQNYRLAHWRTASEELDYRRFFSIDTLVGVRIEDPAVFAETHSLILDLVSDGTVDGLRIDHVDGLRDPEGYLDQLEERSGGAYTVVEKILEPSESLPETWPVSGTSGYDFLIRVNNLFVAGENEQAMSECYVGFTGESASYEEIVQVAKQQIMARELAAEVDRVTSLLADVCDAHRRHRDHTRRELREALREVVARFPVYRTYVHPRRRATDADRRHVARAVDEAIGHRPDLDEELVRFIGALALADVGGDTAIEFTQRFQQLTAPVMAKGVEDTAFYRYHRLISLNEVGGDPGVFGRSPTGFHADTAAMAVRWPGSMLTLSTHDTKRSADVRARLNVLSEVPDQWRQAVQRWADANRRHDGDDQIDGNAEYLLYQTLVGAWPLDADRAVAFMAKATKEAKVHTSWTDPDASYDDAVEGFVRGILEDPRFVGDLERFLAEQRIVARGRRSSLAQTTLLLTCPGVPDIYQGTELWDLSLVDPDNRRPVDYELRRGVLDEVSDAKPADVLSRADRGDPKLWLVNRLLHHRRQHAERYESTDYQPLELHGARADDALGFARGGLAVVVPRLGGDAWHDTRVTLGGGSWTDLLTGASFGGGPQRLDEVLGAFPVAVLTADAS